MDHTPDRATVRSILERATEHPWRIQSVGLLGLRLDDRHEFRLHVWDPEAYPGDPVIHDHPYDFTSDVIVGEVTNTRYAEDPTGAEYRRERYAMADEHDRCSDAVRLAARTEVLRAGERYHHLAPELHDSRQAVGTVTVIRCTWRATSQLTVCLRPGEPWVSGQARPATAEEIRRITAPALDLLASA